MTIEVDEKLLAAARTVAEPAGVPTEELYERARREVLARDRNHLADEVAADQQRRGVSVRDDDGLALAYGDLRAARAEGRDAS